MKILFGVASGGVIFTFLFFIFTSKEQRWLIVHEHSAVSFAGNMLKPNHAIEATPKLWANYTVIAKDGYVLFFDPDGDGVTYGYFPTKKPNAYDGEVSQEKWLKIGDDWFFRVLDIFKKYNEI